MDVPPGSTLDDIQLPGTPVPAPTRPSPPRPPLRRLRPRQSRRRDDPAPAPDGGGERARAPTADRPRSARALDAASRSRVGQEPRARRRGRSLEPRMRSQGEASRPPLAAPQPRRHAHAEQPRLHRRPPRPLDGHRSAQLHHPQVPRAALPAADLPGRRDRVRHPLGDPRRDQRDRDGLRPQPERVLRGRARLDAVHAGHLEGVRNRRQQGRPQGSVQPGRRDLRRRPLPQGRQLRERRPRRDLGVQPRRLVRRLRPPPRAPDRRRAGRRDRLAHRPHRGPLPRLRTRALRGRHRRAAAAQARAAVARTPPTSSSRTTPAASSTSSPSRAPRSSP